MEFLSQTLSRSPDAIWQLVTLLVRSRGGRQQHVSLTGINLGGRLSFVGILHMPLCVTENKYLVCWLPVGYAE